MWKPDDKLHIVYDSGPQDLFDSRKIALTLTFRKLIRLDCVEEGLDESCHEPRDTVPRRVLVKRLAEVLGDHSWRTGSIGGGRLKQAEQQQPSKTVTLPTPAHHCCEQSHACTWHHWVNSGENRWVCVWWGSPQSTKSTRYSRNKTKKKDKCNYRVMMKQNHDTLNWVTGGKVTAQSKWKKTERHSGAVISEQAERKRKTVTSYKAFMSSWQHAEHKGLLAHEGLL